MKMNEYENVTECSSSVKWLSYHKGTESKGKLNIWDIICGIFYDDKYMKYIKTKKQNKTKQNKIKQNKTKQRTHTDEK